MESILFLGDSLTDCGRFYSDDGLGHGYVKLLAEKLPYRLINEGFDGFTAADVKRRFESCLKCEPELVSLLVGVNDIPLIMRNGGGLDSFSKAYEYIIAKICEYKAIVMLPFLFTRPAELLTWRKYLYEIIETEKNICEKYNVKYIQMNNIFKNKCHIYNENELTTDGIHLTRLGHSILADSWYDAFTVGF